MRTLQSAAKAVLFLLPVLALFAPSAVSALSAHSSSVSGIATIQPLTLGEDSAVLPSSPDSEAADSTSSLPAIAIQAINPGYNLPPGKNSGELIELVNLSDAPVDLSSVSLVYVAKPTTASPEGKETILFTFPSGATFLGDTILFRYALSPEAETGNQDLTYDATSLAMSGSLKLVKSMKDTGQEEIISSVCWLGGDDCLPIFSTTVKTRSYTTILRDNDTGKYSHVAEYTPAYDPDITNLYFPEPDDETTENPGNPDGLNNFDNPDNPDASDSSISLPSACPGLQFSEILTYYSDDASEQFIELYNSSSTSISLSNCRLRYKNKLYSLTTTTLLLAADSYYTFSPPITLTKNPTTTNLYELLDQNDDLVDSLSLPHGQKKSASYALIGKNPNGTDNWQITYAPTPGRANVLQEFRTCPAGKIINEATGNCINASTLSTVTKDCGAGKYRNPATGRCKSYDSSDSSEAAPCKEGYERNPETNRCRKIKQNNGADYPLVPITDTEDNTSFIALWALIGVVALGAFYVLFQFRRDLYYFFRRLINKLLKH